MFFIKKLQTWPYNSNRKGTEARNKTYAIYHGTVELLSLLVVKTQSSQEFAWEKVSPIDSGLPVMVSNIF